MDGIERSNRITEKIIEGLEAGLKGPPNKTIVDACRKVELCYEKRLRELGYKGCENCVNQIEPLRACEWLENGGDGVFHPICPCWEKREG